jgi:hypothetical protein
VKNTAEDLSDEFSVSIVGGLVIGVLYGADAIGTAILLPTVAVCASFLTLRVMRKVLR